MKNKPLKIKPLRDKCLIKKDKNEEKTEGGVYLPSTSTDPKVSPPQTGVVVAVGPGYKNEQGTFFETTLNKGDKVLFPKYVGTDCKELEDDMILIPEKDILAVIEESVT